MVSRLPPDDLKSQSKAARSGYLADLEGMRGGVAEVDASLLANVLRAADRLDEVARILSEEGLTVNGSKGQKRPHPLLALEQSLRREESQGFDQLQLSPKAPWRADVDEHGRLSLPRY
jgi:hypothetical protein